MNETNFELNFSLRTLMKLIQRKTFLEDIMLLIQKKQGNTTSNISSLKPFLDQGEISRVGGHFGHSNLTFTPKPPTILPSKYKFMIVLIIYKHICHLHAGPLT